MRIVKATYEILDELDGDEILRKIERVARVCYKSEDRISDGSAERMVRALTRNGHEAMLEHFSFSVLFTVDRGVSHEIVRHRLASFAQESTRYCDYGREGVTFIEPCYLAPGTAPYREWEEGCRKAEGLYYAMRNLGSPPEQARAVLPTSLKTELVVTANLREFRHILRLRAAGETGKPHVQMMEVMLPLLKELKAKVPAVFEDIPIKEVAT